MVDVGEKAVTRREAVARGAVRMAPATVGAIVSGQLKKGEALAAARIAGIMAAKRTYELIPLCHQIALEVVEVDFRPHQRQGLIEIQARALAAAPLLLARSARVQVSPAPLTVVLCLALEPSELVKATSSRAPGGSVVLKGVVVISELPCAVMYRSMPKFSS